MTEDVPEPRRSGSTIVERETTAPADIACSLREMIVDGELAAGERITERTVVTRFNCTASSTREAFHLLEKQGAIIVSARRGARVIDADHAPPRELFVVWDRLRWLLGEELKRSGAPENLPAWAKPDRQTRSQRLERVRERLETLSKLAANPRLADLMSRIALHVCIVAPDRFSEIEESLHQ